MSNYLYDFKNKEGLVDHLKASGVLHSPEIINALMLVDRKDFIPSNYADYAYCDDALPIGFNQTISQPTTLAIMLELLQAKKGNRSLEIGSGSGWATALLGYLVGNEGSVVGIELIPELTNFGKKNLEKYNLPQAKIQKAGHRLGIPNETFDRILVSAAADKLPVELLVQLKLGGKMVIPLRHSIFLLEKDLTGNTTQKEIPGFVFVPLIH